MSTTTTNFGWTIPSDTDLVTDGAAAMRALGNGIDASFPDLKGGTTGQILAKASATDLDFSWITNDVGDITAVNVTSPITGGGTSGAVTIAIQDASTTQKGAVQLSDSTSTTSSVLAATPTAVKAAYDLANGAIPKTLTTTTGDTIYASSANTPARLPIGSTNQMLSVTGGVPAWKASSTSTLTTTGDTLYASSANTLARLGIGSTGQVLTVVGGVPAWSAAAGKIIQVVQGSTSTVASNSTQTYADSGLSATITPTKNTSTILVMVSQNGCSKTTGSTQNGLNLKLFRDATDLGTLITYLLYTNSALENYGAVSFSYIDSPASTSAITYKTKFANAVASAAVKVQDQSTSSITLFEIGA